MVFFQSPGGTDGGQLVMSQAGVGKEYTKCSPGLTASVINILVILTFLHSFIPCFYSFDMCNQTVCI